jgi:hypothetical protein
MKLAFYFLFACGVFAWAQDSSSPAPAPAPAATSQISPAPAAAPSPSLVDNEWEMHFNRPAAGTEDYVKAPLIGTKAWVRQHFDPQVPRIQLRQPLRLSEFVQDGKLELSLKNYMELVLANNTDIEIQRLNVELPRNAITRAAGIFDPTLQTQFNAQRSNTPTTDVLAGAATLSQLNQPWSANYVQTLSTGTQIRTGFTGSRQSTNSQFQTFNPSFGTNLVLGFTQPLLRGRGSSITKLPISIARSRLRQAQFNVEDQLIRIVAQAETAYWNLIEARENLRVQEKALELADAALKRAQRELELGATSQLDIFQPQAQYANAEIFVTQARFRLAQVEDQLRRQIAADLDPDVRGLPIVLTEPVTAPTDNAEFDREALIARAVDLRPDLRAQRAAARIEPERWLHGHWTRRYLFPANHHWRVSRSSGPRWHRRRVRPTVRLRFPDLQHGPDVDSADP